MGSSVSSLRRHDPDQLLTVGGRGAALSARRNGLPLTTDGSARRLARLWAVDRRARACARRPPVLRRRPRRDARALDGALAGGVDLFQLRDKDASDDELLGRRRERARALPRAAGALFIVNDRPDLAAASGADGVHVGQDDTPVAARASSSATTRIVGLSTHSMQQAQAGAASGADYIAVGPVHATPTKEGRPAIGVEPIALRRRPRRRPVVRHRRPRRRHGRRAWSRPARGGSSSMRARSPTPTTPRRRARCAPRTERGRGVAGAAASGARRRAAASQRRRCARPLRRIACAAATRAPRAQRRGPRPARAAAPGERPCRHRGRARRALTANLVA